MAGAVAVKVARSDIGRECNRLEAAIWAKSIENPSRRARLCPVLWGSADGSVLVMAAAAPLPPAMADDPAIVDPLDWWNEEPGTDDWPWQGERKPENWGLLAGRIVLVDYSTSAL